MSYVHFAFHTPAFKDDAATKSQNINEIAGCALAKWLSARLAARGFVVSEIWPEDHGWDFGVSHDGRKFQCACSINDDEEPVADAHVVIGPKAAADDPLAEAIRAELGASNDVLNLEIDTAR